MARSLSIVTLLAVFSLFFVTNAQGRTFGVTTVNKVNVRAEPTSRSESLIRLPKGKKMEVLGKRGDWYKVRMKLPDGFSFNGYIYRKSLHLYPAPKPSQHRTPVPMYRPPRTTPKPTYYTPPPAQSHRKQKASYEVGPSTSSWSGFQDRFYINVGPSVFLYQYKLNNGGTTPAQLFSYNLPGFGIRLNSGFWVWEGMQTKLRAGLFVGYGHAFLQVDTNLADSNGDLFEKRKSKSSIQDIIGGAALEYRFKPDRNTIALGLKVGYEYFKFNGDDIIKNDGTALNVYVDQTTKTILLSVYSKIPFQTEKPSYVQLGADILALNSVAEKPANTTGTNPSASLGFAPYVRAAYSFKEHHFAKFGYQARFQNFNYSGTGSRLTPDNVTDGSVKTMLHEISLAYEYRF